MKCFCNTKIYVCVIGLGEIFLLNFCPRYDTEIIHSLACMACACEWCCMYHTVTEYGMGCCVYFVSPCRLVHSPVVPVSQEMKHLALFSGMNHCYQYNQSPTKQNKLVAYNNMFLYVSLIPAVRVSIVYIQCTWQLHT